MKTLRCAVYTRKSTEDGLEQEFNSLDAQREACEAYILSQRHEGWTLVQGRYDDGGFSGGNMERPGMKALMADVDAGLVDVIVVYKVDRLTRSLADFAKIVERLDAKQASFVSVTQAFNTTTSMGRLTLNVLLSFAQFEREVTGERIRDKIAASKKKGIWMGGPVPLGYQVVERKLVTVPEEAERVRTIMRRYLEIKSAPALIERLRVEGVVTKVQNRTSGPHRGGISFRRGSLFYLLKNPVYRGKIVHKGHIHDGEHEPIVDADLWDAVQAQLKEKAPPRGRPKNDRNDAFFNGLITDAYGRPVVPTYTSKNTRRYAYYETRKDLARPGDPAPARFQQGKIDRQVMNCICEFLSDEHGLRRFANSADARELRSLFEKTSVIKARVSLLGEARSLLRSLVTAIRIQQKHLEIDLDPCAMGMADQSAWTITTPLPTKQPFREAKLRIDADASVGRASDDLLNLVADAMEAQRLALASPELSLNQIAKQEGRCRTQLARLLRLSWMSPRIIEAIADGTPLPVLDPGRGRAKTGRLWVYARDQRGWSGPEPPAAICFYEPDRKAARPKSHLGAYSGILHVDGYAGFEQLTAGGKITLAACWAHTRRKFYEIAQADGSPIAIEAVRRIAEIYALEAQVRGRSSAERLALRQEVSRPLVNALRVWLETQLHSLSARGKLAEAIRYALARWAGLCRFLDDGCIELDTNPVERAIRPVALGRKNHLFAGSDDGGKRWATMASLLETCKLNGVEPHAWLIDTLTRMANGHPASQLDELLPWNWKASAAFNPAPDVQ